ncbi:mandelate racemase/muconate lactonizing enzyme family protein [Microbacterium sp. SSM24]|uniref:mandelate racemase/muconate lactonizing enzyme family protein n=1 Tax=Microbacterium sp. SSM24 TaxID=2991714 RepID=UPI00222755EB|nr:mandelate racemase/muconate lactonizing enzyme family protein [Microbacterium sp. SSM24]MCW3492589.1 mandelate racemase/muconate lactonizing enzyme family protein [Microbacterium sp. SSM24]
MPRPWEPASPDCHVIAVLVTDSDGRTGQGFSWTPTIGAAAITALLRHDITKFAVGRPADPREVWTDLWTRLHEIGGGGVTTIAMAGLDTALWDLVLRSADETLLDALGRTHDRAPVYGSGVNLHYSRAQLADQVGRWVARGYRAAKMKVGTPDLERDRARVRLARDILGDDRLLMLDANQRWDVETAAASITRLADFVPAWIEEPLRSDDLVGYRRLRRLIDTPIALGENLHNIHQFRTVLEAGIASYIQPNVIRVGGITPFLEIAQLADEYGVPVAPHALPDLSGQLALARADTIWVEDIEDAGLEALGVLTRPSPVRIEDGWAVVEEQPGLGLEFVGVASGGDESVASEIGAV